MVLKTVLTAKSPVWRYENEGRIIRPIVGAYEIPRNILKGVARTRDNDQKLIRSIVEKYYHRKIYGRVVQSRNDFGIVVKEVD